MAEDAAEDGATWIEPAFDADRYTMLRADSPYKLFETSEEGWAFVLHAAQITSEKTGVGIGFISAIDRTRSLEQAIARAQLTSNLIASKSHLINPKNINNGDRICQAELVEKVYHSLTEIKEPPVQKTERDGGFGSTGT